MLQVEHLCKSFGGITATNDISLEFPARSLNAIIGPNGAGKTTFFNLVSGHLRADSGRVVFDGEDITGLSSLKIVRRGLARAFQVASIFPELTLEDSLTAVVISHRGGSFGLTHRFPQRAARERAHEIMEMLDLGQQARTLSRNLPHGDQKLLDIALALALEPKLLLLDEPTAGMGSEERWQMIEKIRGLWKSQHLTVVFIEHDMDIVFRIAQRIFVLKYGTLLAEGTAGEIRANRQVIDAYLGEDHSAEGEPA